MMPRDNGGVKIDLPNYRRPLTEAVHFLGYWLVAATIAAGVVLAVIFATF